jgi:hypothetical protein
MERSPSEASPYLTLEEPQQGPWAEALRNLAPGDDAAPHGVGVVEGHASHGCFANPVVAERVVVPTGFWEAGPVVTRTRAARQLFGDSRFCSFVVGKV